jgi:hypothetical protein
LHKAPPMDALKYPAHLYNTAHNFFAFLANALVCILNNLAIKIWAGLFYLDNPLWYSKHQQRKATNIEAEPKIFFTKNYSHFVERCSGIFINYILNNTTCNFFDLLFFGTNNLNVFLFAKNHLQSIQRIWLVLLPTFFKSSYKQARVIGSFRKVWSESQYILAWSAAIRCWIIFLFRHLKHWTRKRYILLVIDFENNSDSQPLPYRLILDSQFLFLVSAHIMFDNNWAIISKNQYNFQVVVLFFYFDSPFLNVFNVFQIG